MTRPLVLVALLAAAALAGCAGNSPDGEADTGPEFDDLGLEATSSTGVIRGVVVDDAIRPVAGATVTLQGDAPREATTTAVGTFGFDGLQAGTYFLEVTKPGYFAAQQSADVVAGVAEPAIVKVLLQVDAANTPYYEAYVFEGYIECSGTFVAVGFAACSAVNLVTDIAGAGNLTQDNFATTYDVARTPDWIQSEMVWDSTQALGGEMSVMYSWGDCGGFLCDHGVSGSSPLLLTANAEEIAEINDGELGAGDDELFVRVFNEGLSETQVGVGGGLGLTFQQRFTVFTHIFYGYAPTDGWRISAGDPVPQPA